MEKENKVDKKAKKVHHNDINRETYDKEIAELKTKIGELENKILYKDAELINYRKRKDDEVSQMLKYSNGEIILNILGIVDDFERAISLDDDILDDEVSKFLSGFKMIYTRLINILDTFEVKEIDALGKPFDPTYHQAVLSVEDKNYESNVVIEVLQKGYMYKDRVIRPSMVKVSK